MQSHVPGHAELHLLLSMITPLGWLERVPTYKDQQAQLKEKDLATYGFLGYPLLQSADILIYRPGLRAGGRGPGGACGDDARGGAALQPHLRPGSEQFATKVKAALAQAGPARASTIRTLRRALPGRRRSRQRWRRRARWCEAAARLDDGERELLLANLEGEHHQLLPAPEVLLTPTPKVPGLDGRKMSKSYGNTIGLTEEPESIDAQDQGR